MTDTAKGAHADIAFMRGLAEEGQGVAPLIGSLMILMGVVYGTACLAVYAMNMQFVPAPADWRPWPIRAALWVWVIGSILVKQRFPRSRARLDRNLGAVWSGAGIAAVTVIICLALIERRLHAPNVFFAFPSVFLALYGAGWVASAALAHRFWMGGVAAASFAAALISADLTARAPYVTLGVCFLLLMAAPGAMILHQARRPG